MTTAKGRQQQRMIYKRHIEKIMIENEKDGKYEPKKLVAKRVKEELGEKAKAKMKNLIK